MFDKKGHFIRLSVLRNCDLFERNFVIFEDLCEQCTVKTARICQMSVRPPLGEAALQGPARVSQRILTGLDSLLMSGLFCPLESESNC